VVFLSALKPPRRVLDSTHIDHTATDNTGSTDTHRTAPSQCSTPALLSAVGRVVVRSILLFWRADWSFSSTVAIVGGDDPALLLQAGASRAFSSTVVLSSAHLKLLSVSA
jgi:hypothetical protein